MQREYIHTHILQETYTRILHTGAQEPTSTVLSALFLEADLRPEVILKEVHSCIQTVQTRAPSLFHVAGIVTPCMIADPFHIPPDLMELSSLCKANIYFQLTFLQIALGRYFQLNGQARLDMWYDTCLPPQRLITVQSLGKV